MNPVESSGWARPGEVGARRLRGEEDEEVFSLELIFLFF